MIRDVPVIALLTDFGNHDPYVGIMKGVILSICPRAQLIDLSHRVDPQNVRQAAYQLLMTTPYMPPHTIYLVVVDPGVGSARRAIGIETDRGVFIGPDNGVFSYVFRQQKLKQSVLLENFRLSNTSATFHGRDIFAPSAAHVAAGKNVSELGAAISKLEKLADPRFEIHEDFIHGEVVHIDHFGNIVTSIGQLQWDVDDMLRLQPIFEPQIGLEQATALRIRPEASLVKLNEKEVGALALTYAGVAAGDLLTLVNSAGQLEIAVNHGSAAQHLGAKIGDLVTLFINARD